MKKTYQSPEIHYVELTPMPGMDLAHASDEELLKVMKEGSYFENKVCYQKSRNVTVCKMLEKISLVSLNEQFQISGMILIDATEEFLWKKLEKRRTKADLINLLVIQKREKREAADAKVSQFIEKAIKNNLIIGCDMKRESDSHRG